MSSNNLATSSKHSERMRKIKQKDTETECMVRDALNALGISYQVNLRDLPGRPDIVNKTEQWAIMVHGCFWHGHDCKHGIIESKTNTEKWRDKIEGNRQRDKRKRFELESLGFFVDEIWECELKDRPKLVARIAKFVESARERLETFAFDSDNGSIIRRVLLNSDKAQISRIPLIKYPDLKSAVDAFDYAWLRSLARFRPLQVGGEEVSCVDLFSGCGGLSLGVREACYASGRHFRSILAMDSNSNALAVYKANFDPEFALSDDLTLHIDGDIGFPITDSERALLRKIGHVDLVVAGPPCQGHSNLNNHTRRNDDRNDLYQKVARFVEIAEPKWVIVENVAAVVHDVRGGQLRTRKALEQQGYFCNEETVNLSHIGVPQLRKRHVLVASRYRNIDISEIIAHHKIDQPRSVSWAINDLADNATDTIFDTPRKLSAENYRRIEWLFANDQYDLPNELRPDCHKGEHTYYAMYGRLYPNKPANTITTGFGSPGQGRYIHPIRQRTLTAHEAARLQMFPDFFDFSAAGSYKSLSKMIGNAVPMKLSYLLTLALLRE